MRLSTALLILLGLPGGVFPAATSGERSDTQLAARLPLTQTYACTLNVWNRETQAGGKDLPLTAFRLTVAATRREQPGSAACPSAKSRFWLDHWTLQYVRHWQPGGSGRVEQGEVDWNKLRIRTDAGSETFKTVRQLSPRDTLARLELYSEIAMGRNDLLRLGIFHFQPDRPGVYALHFTLQRGQTVTFSTVRRIEFFCPEPAPQLTLLHAVSIDTARANYRHLPLVASTFFEADSDRPNQNDTDRSLHSLFLGMVAQRLARQPLQGDFLVLEDPLLPADRATQLRRATSRAQFLLSWIERSARTLQKANACAGGQEAGAGGETASAFGLGLREASAAEQEIYLKRAPSEVSPQWFAEENRVVPLVFAPAAQQLVFAPVRLAHDFSADCATFRLSQLDTLLLGACLQGAELVVTDVAGHTLTQRLSPAELRELCRPQKILALRSPAWWRFLKPGKYTASLRLNTACETGLATSNAITFDVPAPRAEIFTFSPYDRVELCYDIDRERVTAIGAEIVQSVREHLTLPTSRTLVFITGHSDSLGEHRRDGRGSQYNLDLSFRRARHLAALLQTALAEQARRAGLELRIINEHLPGNGPSRPPQLAAHARPVVQAGTNGRHPGYRELIIAEKLRAFDEMPVTPRVPARREIENRIAAIRDRLPMETVHLQLSDRDHSRDLAIVIAGFGVTVPFHRRLEEAPEVVEAFCVMGYKPQDIPRAIFGDDAHPAGRFLNRRAELHVIW
ncbi:MAG: hypothetical protein ONB48_05515 [candidate division KSB1 bacterium]|nr:hypothetical protein [candidate division KSB1 bacterium]MDZ7273005.1 hypothetical protein [candidate division KSB1 bacterium]MDZ7285108.1 hypothetical protein [candidate division KSB1 bacterium]MDZ7298140.1 hypothetical protein [candidate division KSB1 bacterium]MDZ7308805.1 hypothetical protein [candidate division KSB1 bacterium]